MRGAKVVDIGCGVPLIGGVHNIAGPHPRIVYADIDPVAVSLIRHTLADHHQVAAVHGDLRQPGSILDHPITQSHLDLSQPVAVLLTGVLPHVPDSDDPAGIIAQIRRAVASGSYLAVSHLSPVAAIRAEQDRVCRLYDRTPTPMCLRSREQLADLLAGWELVEPGIVPVTDWHPNPDLHGDRSSRRACSGRWPVPSNPTRHRPPPRRRWISTRPRHPSTGEAAWARRP